MQTVISHRPIHVLAYGDSGAGKSTFAATFPKPMLVFAFDPWDKSTPYLKKGVAAFVDADERGTPAQEVIHRKTGELLVRVEHYLDADPYHPEAYARFLKRMHAFTQEYEQWTTVVIDSITFMELAARKYEQYVLNKSAKDPRQWYAGSKQALEEMLMIRFANLPMNVVISCHVSEDKDELHGTFVRTIHAVGKLGKQMPAGYGEMYRLYVKRNEQGLSEYRIQTRSDSLWAAASQIGAPDETAPHYLALWAPEETLVNEHREGP
jgi:hypothetical protein